MNNQSFNALAHRTALAALSAAEIVARTSPIAEAKGKNKSKKRKNKVDKKAKQKCKQQVEECTVFIEGECGGAPECLAAFLPCCEFAGSCDLSGTLGCFLGEP
jgi:hypothetical protein